MTFARVLVLFTALVIWGLAQASPVSAQSAAGFLDLTSNLVDIVRQNTSIYRDVNVATQAGYGPVLGCVTGPAQGAMGVHFVHPTLLMNDTLDPTQPEALIYEIKDGVARLVGVEFIVLADLWHQTHEPQDPPVLAGQLLNYNGSPNRFGLPAFYELHVWAWRNNPLGAFVDWNTQVSCDQKSTDQ